MKGSTIFKVDDPGLYVAEPVDNGIVRFWKRTGQTENPRVVASADAASVDGVIHTVHVEDGLVLLQHWNGGIMRRYSGTDRIKPAAVTFERVDPLFADDAEGGR